MSRSWSESQYVSHIWLYSGIISWVDGSLRSKSWSENQKATARTEYRIRESDAETKSRLDQIRF